MDMTLTFPFYLIEYLNTFMSSIYIQDWTGLSLACFVATIAIDSVCTMAMPGVRCPRCVARG